MAYVTDYTALLTGSYWNGIEVAGKPSFVTYSFDATAPASDKNTLSASAYATFAPFTAAQQQEAQQALQEWGNSGVIFLQVAPGQGDINLASYNFSTDPNYNNAGGIGFYPFGNWDYATYPYFATDTAGSGNILMNTAFETNGLFDYATMLHEEGHALGLKHPDQAWTDYATNPATVHNVWDPNTPLPKSVMNEGPTNLTHLGAIDIKAIQAIYGKPSAQGTMDKSYSWDTTTYTLTQHVTNAANQQVRGISTNNVIYAGNGTDIIDAIGAGTNTVYAGSGTDTLVGGLGTSTLFAGGGADTFVGTFGSTIVDYAQEKAGVTVDLAAPWMDTGAAADDSYVDIDAVIGTRSNDVLTGSTTADRLSGGNGNDVLAGGGGADKLSGGAGADIFAYDALADSTAAAAGRDTITDFTPSQGDVIDLSQLASSTGTTLEFIGSAAFDGTAGEVRYAAQGSNTLVSLDDTGSGKADFAILLSGQVTLTASDFVLSGPPAVPAAYVADGWFAGHATLSPVHPGSEMVLPHLQ